MAKENIKSKKGFTIIEVVLVLAIAGLIFLMVFIALPALQRGQRNTQREDDLARFLTAVTDFQSNNSGRLPFTIAATAGGDITQAGFAMNAAFISRYIDDDCAVNAQLGAGPAGCGDQFTDPDGTTYQFQSAGAVTMAGDTGTMANVQAATFDHTIYVSVGFICGQDEGTVRVGSGNRQLAMFMVLEGGGITCNDNQ